MKEGYKKTKIGEIPVDWESIKLEDGLSKIVGGGTPSREKSEYWNGEIPWASVKDFKSTIIKDTIEYISEEGLNNSSSTLISKNTLVIPTRMALGKVAFFEKDVAINQDLKALTTNEKLRKEFLFFWFENNADFIERLGSGSTVKGIRLEVLRKLSLLLPPRDEQKKIATILTTVDEKIATITTKIQATESLKKGLMQRLLTQGIGHTKFKESKLGRIPESWEVVRLNDVTETLTDGSHFSPVPKENTGYIIGTVKDMRTRNFNLSTCVNISKEDYEALVKGGCKPEKGNILFSKDGTIGKTFVCDGLQDLVLLSSVAIIRLKEDKVFPDFVCQVLKSSIFYNQLAGLKSGSAIRRLVLKAIKEIKIPLLEISEQKKIASILNVVDEKIEFLHNKKTVYQDLKKGLMQQLLTGKIRVKIPTNA